ncbi:HD domain-containing protein [Archaeoglobus veneficus]|uniref:HD domain-containing protein n=1 Tax=Archaeoglobus veneficus TaxID=58290 RepID=UPI000693FFDC|nr:HD domain-containing protein [Archaeoglobus veneficus]
MEIRDPVHGFVHLSEAERAIVDSKPFQRLRNIRQLGMSYYVYPSAVHTRFEHSIGTMHVANQIFDVLDRKHGKYFDRFLSITGEDDPRKRLRKTLRLAALLHDIGHAPFSHATEDLFPKNMSHEEISAEIVRTELESIFRRKEIERSGIKLDDVIFLIYPEMVSELSDEDAQAFYLLRGIISGDIDADRIDYLTRDSHHTGVIYGKFDYIRLIDTITIVPFAGETTEAGQELDNLRPETPEPRIGVEYGGLHTIEGLLLARYFMFLQVYFHHVRRIYDLMLTDFLKYSLPEGHYPADIDEYLKYDDVRVLTMIREEAEKGSCKEAKVLARRLLSRKHPKSIFEENKPILRIEEFEKELKGALQKKFNKLDPSALSNNPQLNFPIHSNNSPSAENSPQRIVYPHLRCNLLNHVILLPC